MFTILCVLTLLCAAITIFAPRNDSTHPDVTNAWAFCWIALVFITLVGWIVHLVSI